MTIEIKLCGVFACRAPDGGDLTPRGAREKGILALLALSPERIRSRNWLKSKLWSERFDDQANTSLRRALSNIRKSLGPCAGCLGADRNNVWLTPDVKLLRDVSAGEELLEDVFIADPEFDDWLRDTRLACDTACKTGATAPVTLNSRARMICILTDEAATREARLLQNMLGDVLAERLIAAGSVEVFRNERLDRTISHDRIEVGCYPIGNQWVFSLSVTESPRWRHVWSGRTRVSFVDEKSWASNPFAKFCNEAVAALNDRKFNFDHQAHPYFLLNFAASRLFTGQVTDVDIGLTLLETMTAETDAALPLAWRGFAKLTKAMDNPDMSLGIRESATEDAARAVAMSSTNSTALALASHVNLMMTGDLDYAKYLAHKAISINDSDPYAGFAASTAAFFNGETRRGIELINWSRDAAAALPNSYFWDAQCAILGLSSHDLDASYSSALRCFAKMPTYRPALRYLIAISLLQNRTEDAQRFVDRLGRLEHGFAVSDFADENYPVPSLRRLGLCEETANLAKNLTGN